WTDHGQWTKDGPSTKRQALRTKFSAYPTQAAHRVRALRRAAASPPARLARSSSHEVGRVALLPVTNARASTRLARASSLRAADVRARARSRGRAGRGYRCQFRARATRC